MDGNCLYVYINLCLHWCNHHMAPGKWMPTDIYVSNDENHKCYCIRVIPCTKFIPIDAGFCGKIEQHWIYYILSYLVLQKTISLSSNFINAPSFSSQVLLYTSFKCHFLVSVCHCLMIVYAGTIVDSVTTGAFEFVVSTQRLLGEEEKPLVSPRSDELELVLLSLLVIVSRGSLLPCHVCLVVLVSFLRHGIFCCSFDIFGFSDLETIWEQWLSGYLSLIILLLSFGGCWISLINNL